MVSQHNAKRSLEVNFLGKPPHQIDSSNNFYLYNLLFLSPLCGHCARIVHEKARDATTFTRLGTSHSHKELKAVPKSNNTATTNKATANTLTSAVKPITM